MGRWSSSDVILWCVAHENGEQRASNKTSMVGSSEPVLCLDHFAFQAIAGVLKSGKACSIAGVCRLCSSRMQSAVSSSVRHHLQESRVGQGRQYKVRAVHLESSAHTSKVFLQVLRCRTRQRFPKSQFVWFGKGIPPRKSSKQRRPSEAFRS